MPDAIGVPLAHVFGGGLAANALLIFGLVQVFLGAEEGSQVSQDRRLPIDSDLKVFGMLFGMGAIIGWVVYNVSGCAAVYDWVVPTLVVAGVAGAAVSFTICSKLNDEYISRAELNLAEGNYKEAIEDAREVMRSSEALRNRAKQISQQAHALRNEQPMGLGA